MANHSLNRASGCNINNPALTASEAMPATWGYANCNRLRGQSEWFAMMFRDF